MLFRRILSHVLDINDGIMLLRVGRSFNKLNFLQIRRGYFIQIKSGRTHNIFSVCLCGYGVHFA